MWEMYDTRVLLAIIRNKLMDKGPLQHLPASLLMENKCRVLLVRGKNRDGEHDESSVQGITEKVCVEMVVAPDVVQRMRFGNP